MALPTLLHMLLASTTCNFLKLMKITNFLHGKKLQALNERNYHINNIMGGDFNTVLNMTKKRGGTSNRDPFKDRMEETIERWDLIDIKHKSGKYTWSNRRGPLYCC